MAIGGFVINKIFVSIAAYEDDLLVNTIKELYEKSKEPQNIFVYIALQYKNPPNLDNIFKGQNLTILNYDVDKRPGVAKVRYEISQEILKNKDFVDGDYFLMIDAHMDVAENWDVDLIRDMRHLQKICNKKEIIISKQLRAVAGKITEQELRINYFHKALQDIPFFSDHLELFGLTYRRIYNDKDLEGFNILVGSNTDHRFYNSGWASCHLFFTNFEFINTVGLNKHFEFFQEEAYLSFSAFLSGYDIYSNINYDYLGHNNINQLSEKQDIRYWRKNENGSFDRIYNINIDNIFAGLCVLAYVNNSGPFLVNNAVRTPEMFFKCFDIMEVYDNLINNKLLLDFLNYMNRHYHQVQIENSQ